MVMICYIAGCAAPPEHAPSDDVPSTVSAALTIHTGAMALRRESFTLSGLANGKALATGGWGGTAITVPAVLASAELYNPATGTFASASALPAPRLWHTATALTGGRVLVAGGATLPGGIVTPAASVYVYSPDVDSWSTTGTMLTARYRHGAARLADGRVLVAGGSTAGNTILSSAEIWNPVTGSWVGTAAMTTPRRGFTLTALADGRALAVGGLSGPGQIVGTAEIYDPASDHWTAIPGLLPRYGHRAFLLPDGRVLIAGGTGSLNGGASNTVLPVIQVFDPVLEHWVNPNATLAVSRSDYEGAVLPGGRVVIAGGADALGHAIADVEVIDTTDLSNPGASHLIAPMAFARTTFGLALLSTGNLLVAGGTNTNGTMADAEIVDTTCAPQTCADQGFACGAATDTCGVARDCGSCDPGQSCTTAHQCCAPTSCAAQGAACGVIPSGCGTVLACGTCSPGSTCTTDHQCCAPTSCAAQGVTCGSIPSGCGTTLACGTCGAGSTCQSGACVPLPDTAPPTASITAPGSGAVVSGTATVIAAASDDVAVTQVEIYDGTTLLGSCIQAPCAVAWNTVAVDAGSHALSARAHDASGKVGISAVVTVTVDNSPAAIVTATLDPARGVPSCLVRSAGCDTATLVNGRGPLGPEGHAPNTINGSCADGSIGTYHQDESIDRVKIVNPGGGALLPGAAVQVQVTVFAFSTTDRLDVWRAADATNPVWTLVGTVTPTLHGTQTLSLSYVLPAGTLQAVRASFRYMGVALACTAGGFDDHDDVVFATQ